MKSASVLLAHRSMPGGASPPPLSEEGAGAIATETEGFTLSAATLCRWPKTTSPTVICCRTPAGADEARRRAERATASGGWKVTCAPPAAVEDEEEDDGAPGRPRRR